MDSNMIYRSRYFRSKNLNETNVIFFCKIIEIFQRGEAIRLAERLGNIALLHSLVNIFGWAACS